MQRLWKEKRVENNYRNSFQLLFHCSNLSKLYLFQLSLFTVWDSTEEKTSILTDEFVIPSSTSFLVTLVKMCFKFSIEVGKKFENLRNSCYFYAENCWYIVLNFIFQVQLLVSPPPGPFDGLFKMKLGL